MCSVQCYSLFFVFGLSNGIQHYISYHLVRENHQAIRNTDFPVKNSIDNGKKYVKILINI